MRNLIKGYELALMSFVLILLVVIGCAAKKSTKEISVVADTPTEVVCIDSNGEEWIISLDEFIIEVDDNNTPTYKDDVVKCIKWKGEN